MSRTGWIILAAAGSIVLATMFLATNRGVPLGVPGEWAWHRQPMPPVFGFIIAALAAMLFVGVCLLGRRWTDTDGRWSGLALPTAMVAALPFHLALFNLPIEGLGMERWFLSLQNPASSGYFSTAVDLENRGVTTDEFLRDYQRWIAQQDSFHIGTHPPGLFVAFRSLLSTLKARSDLAAATLQWAPHRLASAAAFFGPKERLSAAESATIVVAALLPWVAFWLATPIVYLLARQAGSPTASFSVAMLWLAAPGPLLFLPLADVGYVLLSAAIAWLLVAGPTRNPFLSAIAGLTAGAIFFVAINMSLAFVVVLMFAGLAGLIRDPTAWRRTSWWATWLAFLAAVVASMAWMHQSYGLNLLAVFKINLDKHRGFYDSFPRSYWPWVGVNLLEFALSLGAITASLVAAAVGRNIRQARFLVWAFLATLLALDVTGKNLSEAARLWIFLTPLGAASCAPALDRETLDGKGFGLLLICQVFVAVCLYASVEPLLPFASTS